MKLQMIDWAIVAVVITFFTITAYKTKKYTIGVAAFLAADRSAGRYLLAVGDGMAGLGAISAIAMFQLYYEGGFTPIFWNTTLTAIALLVATSGWIIYRFRQTRALTWPQFFEQRYSKKFRVFAGTLCFASGIINFGIFPSVAARFMVYYCNLPLSFDLFGVSVSTYGTIMAAMIGLAVWYACLGGQIAVMVTDFLQGIFCNVVFIVLLIMLFVKFPWPDIAIAMLDRPEGQSMINPFKIEGLKNYDLLYWIIAFWATWYNAYSWQGQQGYNTSAKNAHEARMAKILGGLRPLTQILFLLMITLCVYTLLNNPKYHATAEPIQARIATIGQEMGAKGAEQLQNQMTVPVALSEFLPTGMVGIFCAVIFVFFISTVDTYLHSWGSILLQDVILPFRKKHLTPEKHVKHLRLSIIGVAVFAWVFSYLFIQKSDILMFFALSGMLYLCGQGAVTVGGLYWKRATTQGAWAAMILNLPVFGIGLACDQFWTPIAEYLQANHLDTWLWIKSNLFHEMVAGDAPVTSQEIYFVGMLLSTTAFIVISLITSKKPFNLDKMLHRGEYAIKEEQSPSGTPSATAEKWDWKDVLGFSTRMTKGDKFTFGFAYGYIALYLGAVITLTACQLLLRPAGLADSTWLTFWHVFVWVNFILTIIIIVWFSIGGIIDLKSLFTTLATIKRDDDDDGAIVDGNGNNDS
jgi:SSS family solute:Na+ symporter